MNNQVPSSATMSAPPVECNQQPSLPKVDDRNSNVLPSYIMMALKGEISHQNKNPTASDVMLMRVTNDDLIDRVSTGHRSQVTRLGIYGLVYST